MNDFNGLTIGELVAAIPSSARIFDRVGLDYCCGGQRTLAEACAVAGLDAAALVEEIGALGSGAAADWDALAPAELADQIVAVHHTYLRRELPLLAALAAKVEAVHGARHPEFAEVRALIDELRADLEPHLDKEERVLFPAIRALTEGGQRDIMFGSLANPIRMMTIEHDRAGALLAALRRATAGYQAPGDGCASFRSLCERLVELEHDTHVHIHKENHVLFPAVLREWDRAAGPATSRKEVVVR